MTPDLTPFLMPPDRSDVGFHTGEVLAWDADAGTNTVRVLGAAIQNLQVVATGSVMVGTGDLVAIWRYKSTYFVMGRIAPINQALTPRIASVSTTSFTVSGSYSDLNSTVGPTLTNVFIGPSRRCIVFLSAFASATDDGYAAAHFTVSGASAINPPTGTSAFSKGAFIGSAGAGPQVGGSATRMFLLNAADGLNAGLNTFTMKYLGVNSAGTTPTNNDCFFSERVIMVLPL